MDRNLTLVTFDLEPCQLVLVWIMTLPSEPCHSVGVFNKKNGQKSNPIDFRSAALRVNPDVVNDSPFRALSQCSVFMVAILKTGRPNPNESRLGTLSVGSNIVNKSPFRTLSYWWRVYGSNI